jgi:hypothetical protein
VGEWGARNGSLRGVVGVAVHRLVALDFLKIIAAQPTSHWPLRHGPGTGALET